MKLQAVASSRAAETLELSTFELDRLVGDICHFVADGRVSPGVQSKAYDLCERLDYVRRTGGE